MMALIEDDSINTDVVEGQSERLARCQKLVEHHCRLWWEILTKVKIDQPVDDKS